MIVIKYLKTENKAADILTKALNTHRYKKYCELTTKK